MPPPCLNPARQLLAPLPILRSAPDTGGATGGSLSPVPLLSVPYLGSGKGCLQCYKHEVPTWGMEAEEEEEEGEASVHTHGSLAVWDKLEPVATGAGHHPGPASRQPSTAASPAPGQGQGMVPVPPAPTRLCSQPLATPRVPALAGTGQAGSDAPRGFAAAPRCLAMWHAREQGKLTRS